MVVEANKLWRPEFASVNGYVKQVCPSDPVSPTSHPKSPKHSGKVFLTNRPSFLTSQALSSQSVTPQFPQPTAVRPSLPTNVPSGQSMSTPVFQPFTQSPLTSQIHFPESFFPSLHNQSTQSPQPSSVPMSQPVSQPSLPNMITAAQCECPDFRTVTNGRKITILFHVVIAN